MISTITRGASFAAVLSFCVPLLGSDTHMFFHENILGTSLELRVEAESRQAAMAAESAVLDEIERLRRSLSSYDASSDLRRWLASEASDAIVSEDLFQVLRQSIHFRNLSSGAFNPNVEAASVLWRKCAGEQRLPRQEELRETISQIQQVAWQLDEKNKTAHRLGTAPVNLDALAKGYIVDSACRVAMAQDGIVGILVNIGGDLKCLGEIRYRISIADPILNAENAIPLTSIELKNRAIATSGNYHRGFRIDGIHYSHIIDPRSAQPVGEIVSASVLAENAVVADALATAMSVLEVEESLLLCESMENVECMLVQKTGQLIQSSGWPGAVQPIEKLVSAPSTIAKSGEIWNDQSKLLVEFEINRAGNDGRYRRPYLAIWIEDSQGYPVRTLTLWLQTSQPGPRWHRDLKQWYKNDTMRKLVDGKDLIDSISAATKPPGKYKVVWDGKDDHGLPVKKGKYTFLMEAAREHGTYQIIKKDLEFDDKPITEKLPGNVEIKEALLEYRPGAE